MRFILVIFSVLQAYFCAAQFQDKYDSIYVNQPIMSNSMRFAYRLFPYDKENEKRYVIGSGFFIEKDSLYYLVTALHVITKSKDDSFHNYYPKSIIDSSFKYIKLGWIFADEKGSFKIPLLDTITKKPNFICSQFNDSLLDIALIKINNPSKSIRQNAFKFNQIDFSDTLEDNEKTKAMGYPGNHSQVYTVYGQVIKNYKSNLNPALFYFTSEDKLGGISGGIIYHFKSVNHQMAPIGIYIAIDPLHKVGYGIYLRNIYNLLTDPSNLVANSLISIPKK